MRYENCHYVNTTFYGKIYKHIQNSFVQRVKARKIACNSIAHHKIEIDWYIAFLTAR